MHGAGRVKNVWLIIIQLCHNLKEISIQISVATFQDIKNQFFHEQMK